jgi:hypothetical protein
VHENGRVACRGDGDTAGRPAGVTTASQPAASEWVRQFADALGTPPPDDEEIAQLLTIAGIAAHASERTAAPISTWLVGRSRAAPADAREIAARLATGLRPEE